MVQGANNYIIIYGHTFGRTDKVVFRACLRPESCFLKVLVLAPPVERVALQRDRVGRLSSQLQNHLQKSPGKLCVCVFVCMWQLMSGRVFLRVSVYR